MHEPPRIINMSLSDMLFSDRASVASMRHLIFKFCVIVIFIGGKFHQLFIHVAMAVQSAGTGRVITLLPGQNGPPRNEDIAM